MKSFKIHLVFAVFILQLLKKISKNIFIPVLVSFNQAMIKEHVPQWLLSKKDLSLI